jgi:antitoxin FitA
VATLTIRNLPDDLVQRLKDAAASRGRSMEQEVRDLLRIHYMERSEILDRMRARWDDAVVPSAVEVRRWRDAGRK